MDRIPHWPDDEMFPRDEHRLIIPPGPDRLMMMGECSCGTYLYTGDSYAVAEEFDSHAEQVQRQIHDQRLGR